MSEYFKVCMLVDDIASCVSTPETEYDDTEEEFRRAIFGKQKAKFFRDVQPEDLILSNVDLYIVDYGALSCYGYGRERDAKILCDSILRAIADCPSTIFVINSAMSAGYFKYELSESMGLDYWGDELTPANVVLYPDGYKRDIDAFYDKIRKLLGIDK